MSNSNQSTKKQMVKVSVILSAVAVVMLFLPIIRIQSEDIFGFSLKYTIAGYQFIFGSGNSFVDFIIDNVGDSKAEIAILGILFMAVPALFSIIAAVVRYIFREKRIGSVVPAVLGALAIAELVVLYIITSSFPAVGMILFFMLTAVNIVFNILILVKYDETPAEENTSKKAVKAEGHMLKGVSGAYAGAAIDITEEPIWVGRDSTKCSIVLDGAKVSRQHCCIWLDKSGNVMFKDTSTNGVYFPNGDRMLSNINMELHSGDTIFIGNSENSFQIV